MVISVLLISREKITLVSPFLIDADRAMSRPSVELWVGTIARVTRYRWSALSTWTQRTATLGTGCTATTFQLVSRLRWQRGLVQWVSAARPVSGAGLAMVWTAPAVSSSASCSVVRTPDPKPHVVSHWCAASATTEVPSDSSTRKHGRPTRTSVAATTRVGRPSEPISSSPTSTSPMVVQPSGVGTAVSSASALPIAGRAATITIWPPCRPLVSSSSSAKPVGTPAIMPSRLPIASSSSIVSSMMSASGA